jgi:hypothetical protein
MFVLAQIGFFVGVVFLANIFQANQTGESGEYSEGPIFNIILIVTLTLLIGCIVCTVCSHLTLRNYIISMSFEAYMNELDDMASNRMVPSGFIPPPQKPSKIKVKYPLFLKKGKGGNMFQRAERDDVNAKREEANKDNTALELVAAKPSKSDIRKKRPRNNECPSSTSSKRILLNKKPGTRRFGIRNPRGFVW